ncbi:MAG: TraR/DksA C4-type zinc finger protein [Actinobacteria bacterium]|nr:TraR/DksA C4-type zinc finger protein [Actinomycetota bacterium]
MRAMAAIDTERLKQTLLEERRRVTEAIEYLHDENPGSINDEESDDTASENHPADTASVTLDREIDYSLEENSEHVLSEIAGALQRIEDGTFGLCQSCGKPIAPERLEARPWARQCIDCRRREERA